MEHKLDLTVPGRSRPQSNQKVTRVLLVLILIGVALNMGLVLFYRPPARDQVGQVLAPDKIKDLATRLYQRNLYQQAARAWQQYLACPGLSPVERAKALFQQGLCLEKAGQFADAAAAFLGSEAVSQVEQLRPQINTHLKACLEQSGLFSALRYELMARTDYGTRSDTSQKVVAEIGPEKITDTDLSGAIEAAVEMQLAPVATFMTAEQFNQQRRRILDQYRSPGARLEFLRSLIAQELLYRQALESGLTQQDRTKRFIEQLIRQALAQRMMDEVLASRMNITESDLRTYYQAHKERFADPNQDPNAPVQPRPFEQVRDQVLAELAGDKRQQVQQAYLQEIMDRYQAVIHNSAFREPNQPG